MTAEQREEMRKRFENMSPEVLRRLPHAYMLMADKPAHTK